MKTQQEIEERLSFAEKEGEALLDWCKRAKQCSDEHIAASEALLSARNEINILKWVLNI